ncbi:hypothetical protein ACTXT7_004545 [Hymenolepis weldensis]
MVSLALIMPISSSEATSWDFPEESTKLVLPMSLALRGHYLNIITSLPPAPTPNKSSTDSPTSSSASSDSERESSTDFLKSPSISCEFDREEGDEGEGKKCNSTECSDYPAGEEVEEEEDDNELLIYCYFPLITTSFSAV